MPERRGEDARGWVFTTAKFRVLADKNLDFPGKLAGRLPQNSQKTISVSKVGLTRKEVAAKFGVAVRTIDNWRHKYDLPHYCMGGQVRFVGSEADAWAKTMRRGRPVPGMV